MGGFAGYEKEDDSLVEYWEWRLTTVTVINRDEDWLSRSGTGFKRDKYALWANREKPTRRKLAKLAKRQPDQQSAQQTE
jgi:hypothetical protein